MSPLLALCGHWRVHCSCPFLTQSGQGSCSRDIDLALVLDFRNRIIAAQFAIKGLVMFPVGFRFRPSLVSMVATTLLAGVAMTPVFAQATKLSKAGQRLLKAAIASCKSEAKAKKVKLLDRRQFVVDCVEALKDRPQVNVREVLKNHPDLKKLPCHPNPDPGYKLAKTCPWAVQIQRTPRMILATREPVPEDGGGGSGIRTHV